MAEIPLTRYGRCTVCDKRSGFICRDRNARSFRGRLRCLRCGSQARNRHVALLAARGLGLSTLGDLREQSRIRVLNTSHQSSLGVRLSGIENVTNTGYWPEIAVGSSHAGTRCEDLTALSFPDRTFDLVITEDVLEHVPLYEDALREIRRVLRPKGLHIFSIPIRFDRRSEPRFSMADGTPELHEPISYHSDPGKDPIAVFHQFGYDLLFELEEFGYQTRAVRSTVIDYRRHGIADCLTFVSRAG